MAEENKTNGKSEEAAPASAFVIQFTQVGSSEFGFQVIGTVTPAQILVAAAWLDWMARRQFDDVAAQRRAEIESKKIIVPNAALRPQA